MSSKPKAMIKLVASAMTGTSSRRLALAMAIVFLGSTSASLAATYDFLTVTGNGIGGNSATSQFTSSNGNGFINVTHLFSSGGAGGADNNNTLIFPSQFTTVFPGTGQVQGHLAQTVYNHTSVVTFDLTNYNLSTSTIFGMWNTTDEVTPPVGGAPVYQIQLIDSSNVQVNPTTFNVYGKQDNQTQVAGKHEMDMNPATGEITPGLLINAGGIHTSATFWDNIPTGTKQIIVYGDLPPLNNIGDGVGYYFAEVVPEPSSFVLSALGLLSLGMFTRRRRR